MDRGIFRRELGKRNCDNGNQEEQSQRDRYPRSERGVFQGYVGLNLARKFLVRFSRGLVVAWQRKCWRPRRHISNCRYFVLAHRELKNEIDKGVVFLCGHNSECQPRQPAAHRRLWPSELLRKIPRLSASPDDDRRNGNRDKVVRLVNDPTDQVCSRLRVT